MKVLHLTTHLNTGGITTYILKLVKPLKKLGVEICLVSSGGEWTHDFEERGSKTFALPIRTKNELHPKIYRALPDILKIIRREEIDLLHAHTRITQVVAFWISKITKIPFITTCHGFYTRRIGRRLIPAWGRQAIAISETVADHLREDFKLPSHQIRLINNAVDLGEIDAACEQIRSDKLKSRYGFKAEDPVVGVVARLVRDKGHEYLIRAISVLKDRFPNIRLLIVGAGNYRPPLEHLVKALHLEDHVVFTGNLPDVIQPLLAMDIFALPAVWREGFGLSIVEAMACSKPVIVTNIWALNELIQNGETGILIEPKEVEPLVQAITQLITNKTLRNKIETQGRQMVEKNFSIERMAAEMKDAYEAILQPANSLTPEAGNI